MPDPRADLDALAVPRPGFLEGFARIADLRGVLDDYQDDFAERDDAVTSSHDLEVVRQHLRDAGVPEDHIQASTWHLDAERHSRQ